MIESDLLTILLLFIHTEPESLYFFSSLEIQVQLLPVYM